MTEKDYSVVIGQAALNVLSQTDADNRASAEMTAIEEMSGYLRTAYDCDAVFSATGDRRNRLVVMYCADIALFHMAASVPQKIGTEVRRERYESAIGWLEAVRDGKIVPDLPRPAGTDAGTVAGVRFNSDAPLHHKW